MSSTSPLRRASLRPWSPGGTAAAVGRARLSVVPRLRSRAPRVPFVTLVSVILLGGVIGLLLFNTSMQQASFEASRLQAQAGTLTARQQALQSESDRLNNPQNVAARAAKLHMVVPPVPATLDLTTGKVSGTPTAATPADTLPIAPPPPAAPRATIVHETAPPVDPTPLVHRGSGAAHHNRGRGSDSRSHQNQQTQQSSARRAGH